MPQSSQASDGDGKGDLGGIAERLPQVARLGAHAIWNSPFCTSPMQDFGLDVSARYDVDLIIGCLPDLD